MNGDHTLLDISGIAGTHVTRSTVGFIDATGAKPQSLGSGTLIKFGSTSGLLTCAHVVNALEERAQRGKHEVGIVTFPARDGAIQNMRISFNDMMPIGIGDPPYDLGCGPDIGFLKLAPIHVSTLTAQVSIVDGDDQLEKARTPQPDKSCIEVVAGTIDSWTRVEPAQRNRAKAIMGGLVTTGRIVSQYQSGAFDLLKFEIERDQGLELPSSFEGTSGGGIWRLFYELGPTQTINLVEKRLTGVAFFQRPGEIVGHGPKSIYNDLRKKILGIT